MVRRALPLVLLALLTLTAGCNGLAENARSAPPDRDPFGVDQQVGPSVDPVLGVELLPGLTTAGIVDKEALNERHEEILESESYTVHSVQATENETTSHESEQSIAVDRSSERVYFREVYRGTRPGEDESIQQRNDRSSIEFWTGEDVGIVRTELANGSVEYRQSYISATNVGGHPLSLFALFENATVETERIAGGTYYVIEGRQEIVQRQDGDDEDTPIEEIAFQVYVRDDGLIRHVSVEQTYFLEEDAVTVTDTTTIQDLGETTVERPEWYEEGLEAVRDDADEADEGGIDRERDSDSAADDAR